jgi:hypothetical protein
MDEALPNIRITRYKQTSFWEVWVDDDCVAINCRRELALSIQRVLLEGKEVSAKKNV